jgi:hypothetical protein
MDDELAILSVPTPAGKSPLSVPPSNTEHAYTVGRAMSFWPVVNGNGATWFEEEISKLYANGDDPNLTFKGKLVNIDHSVGRGRGSIIIGVTLQEKYIAGVGVDVLNQLDKRCLADHGLVPEDFAMNGDYSKQSVEINCDRSLSKFIVMLKPNSTRIEDQKVYSAEEAATMGLQRGTLYDGKYRVVEACVPRRIRGVAMVGNPADTTAQVFDIAASKVQKLDEESAVSTSTDTYEDSSGLDNAYGKTQPMSIDNSACDGLDDGAFAVVQGGDEIAATAMKPSTRVRSHPLYESNKHLYSGIPHKGLIKAALDGIGPDKDGKRAYPRDVHAAALQKVRSAHSQLTGDYSMSLPSEEIAKIADPLRADIVRLQSEIAAQSTEKATLADSVALHADAIALKDTEIAGLKAQIKEFNDKQDEQAALEVANARLAELAKIEGFVVADTEKAALLVAIGEDNEDQFKNRLLKEENASLARKLAAGGKTVTDEHQSLADEHAGLKALSGASVKVPKNSAYAALFE